MTPTQPPDSTPSARSTPVPGLARASVATSAKQQQPSRRRQMLYAADHAARVLEAAAEHVPNPDELHQAAAWLRESGTRLAAPKPPRQRPGRLPTRGHATRVAKAARELDVDDLAAVADLARQLGHLAHLAEPRHSDHREDTIP